MISNVRQVELVQCSKLSDKKMNTIRHISHRLKPEEVRSYTVDMLAGLSSLAEQSGDAELALILATTRQQIEATTSLRSAKN